MRQIRNTVGGAILVLLAGCQPLGLREALTAAPVKYIYAGYEVVPASSGLSQPTDVAFDALGRLLVSDTGNQRVVVADPSGTVSPLTTGFSLPGLMSFSKGYLYLTDLGTGNLERITVASGIRNTLIAGLTGPWGVSVDSAGVNLYMSEAGENIVYGRTLADIVNGVFGLASTGQGGYNDGVGTGSLANGTLSLVAGAEGIALDHSATYLYVADTGNDSVRRLNLSSLVMDTIAGSLPPNRQPGDSEGTPGNSRLDGPTDVVADASNNVYVTDTNNNCVRKISPSSFTMSTLATGLSAPRGLAIGPDGYLYVADTGNNRVVRIAL